MPVNEQTIVFPGDAAPVFEQAGTLKKDGFVDHVVHINNHLGTHIDAPGHMISSGKTLSDYDVKRFVCDAICIDARGHSKLTAELIKSSDILPGAAVIFYTGSGDNYSSHSYSSDYPVIDDDLIKMLIERRVSLCGADMISFDHDAPYSNHTTLLSNDILLIENLINLNQVVNRRFTIYALPIRLDLEAAPARVIAKLNADQ